MPVKKSKIPLRSEASKNPKSKITNKKIATTETQKLSASMIARKTSRVGLLVDVFDIKGKVKEKISLPKEIFAAKINPKLMAQAVRVYLANQRKGTASTKTRGEVKGSSRKIYRQKGTGRARHGSIRAPIFVHGGVVFGPKPKDFSLNLPQKMKKAALFSALTTKLKNGEIKIVSGLEKIEPKTKIMAQTLKKLDLNNKGLLFILSAKNENIQRSARNVEGVELLLASQLNAYEVLKNKNLIFMKDAIEIIEKR